MAIPETFNDIRNKTEYFACHGDHKETKREDRPIAGAARGAVGPREHVDDRRSSGNLSDQLHTVSDLLHHRHRRRRGSDLHLQRQRADLQAKAEDRLLRAADHTADHTGIRLR